MSGRERERDRGGDDEPNRGITMASLPENGRGANAKLPHAGRDTHKHTQTVHSGLVTHL